MDTTTLPTLTGSEKQVAWANDIRAEQLARLGRVLAEADPRIAAAEEEEKIRRHIATAMDGLGAERRASWWIDRGRTGWVSDLLAAPRGVLCHPVRVFLNAAEARLARAERDEVRRALRAKWDAAESATNGAH